MSCPLPPPFHTNVDHWVRMSLSHIIFSGVFERFPKLQVGSIEMELSWAPHFLDRMDFHLHSAGCWRYLAQVQRGHASQ